MRPQARTARAAPAPTAPWPHSATYIWWAMTSIVLGGYISVLTNHVMNMVIATILEQRHHIRQVLLAQTQHSKLAQFAFQGAT